MSRRGRVLTLKAALWAAGLAPLGYVAWRFRTDGFGANPIQELMLFLGFWTMVFLTTTLAVTPLRRLTGWNDLIKVRRLLGLWAFAYASLHVLTYVGLDQTFMVPWIVEDVVERPFITLGMAAFLCLVPLALTSTRGWIRRLGKGWRRLHALVYVAGGLGVIHFFWAQKADTRVPELFAVGLIGLLALRLWRRGARRGGARARKGGDQGSSEGKDGSEGGDGSPTGRRAA